MLTRRELFCLSASLGFGAVCSSFVEAADSLIPYRVRTACSDPFAPRNSAPIFEPLSSCASFANFIVADNNRFAHAACRSVAEAPSRLYNPLLIYGQGRVGKTHLLHAIGRHIGQRDPHAKILYLDRTHVLDDPSYLLDWDVILMDDGHSLLRDFSNNGSLRTVLRILYAARKQIVVATHIFPKEMPDFEMWIRGDCDWGLICDIQGV